MIIPYEKNLCSKHAEKMLSIKICSACNMSCSFCVDRGGRDCEKIDVDKIASEAISKKDYKTVIITGGEPFLFVESVISLCNKIRPHKKRIVLNTNGSLLSAYIVEKLNGLIDELQVSVHHYEEKRNANVFGKKISFQNMKDSLKQRKFVLSINSTFNKEYSKNERKDAVFNMIDFCCWIGADNLRLTELKKVDGEDFVLCNDFLNTDFTNRSSEELIVSGCTDYYSEKGINVSVKRLCEYAKGKNAKAFSCCFVDTEGQKKIDIETRDTFKVIYSDGMVFDDWVFREI